MGTYAAYLAGGLILVTLVFASTSQALDGCNETKYVCISDFLKNVMQAFSTSNISIQDPSATYNALNTAYGNFSERCLGISNGVRRAVRLLTPTIGDNSQVQLEILSQGFTRATGYRLEYVLQTPARIEEEVQFQLQTNVSVYDGWLLDVPSSEAARRASGVAKLDALVAAAGQQELQDSDVHPFLSKYGAMYGEHRMAVVLSGFVPLLYWRRDVFAVAKLMAPPTTWEELLAVARLLNGTDMNGDGKPDAALCLQMDECIDASTILSNILASMTQYEGPSSGWLFRPEDLSPLASGPPLERTLELFRDLMRLDARGTKGCSFAHQAFFNGTCAMTIKLAQHFKIAELKHPELRGLVGTAPLPGSPTVWNRASNSWLTCGSETSLTSPCPYATWETRLVGLNQTTIATTRARSRSFLPVRPSVSIHTTSSPERLRGPVLGDDGSTGSSKSISGSLGRRTMSVVASQSPPPQLTAANDAAPQRMLVNRSPFLGMTALLGSIDARTPPDYAAAALSFFALVTSPEVSWAQFGTDSAVGPFRRQHLDDANVWRWLAFNYSREDLTAFLESTRQTLDHPNAALPLRLPGAATLRDVLYEAAQQILKDPNVSVAALATETRKELVAALDVGLPMEEVQRIYWETIGFKGTKPPPYSDESWFDSRSARIGVGLAVAVAGSMLLALAAVLWYRSRRVRRTLFGRALAPGSSAATSLVVTDIVDSTRLWETVSPAAMTRAVQLHHETLRSLLQLHKGYESATEGDAFILSFFSAADATAFALRAQAALLYQPWPDELFQHEPCRPQYALCQAPATDRPRAGITRLPRGAAHGLPSASNAGPEDSSNRVASGAGAGGIEEHFTSKWLAGSTSQLPLPSAKLKMMTTALSLPLKRRQRVLPGAGSGGLPTAATAVAALGPQNHSQPLLRQRGSSSSQLSFPHLPPAPPPVQPRDGFASHSLSQLLLNGSVRNGITGVGGGEPASTEVSTGRLGGGSSNRALQLRTASLRDSHKLRQLQLAGSRGRNISGSVGPYVSRTLTNVNALQGGDGALEGGPVTSTSSRVLTAGGAAPWLLIRDGNPSGATPAAPREAQQQRSGMVGDRSDDGSGTVVYSDTRSGVRPIERDVCQLHEQVMGLGSYGLDAGTRITKAYTAPVMAAATEAAAAADPLSAMAIAAEIAVAATQSSAVTEGYVWDVSSYEPDVGSIGFGMGDHGTRKNGEGGGGTGSCSGGGSDNRGGDGDGAAGVATAVAAVSSRLMDPAFTVSINARMARGPTVASVDGEVVSPAATAVATAEGPDSDTLSATFTGGWMKRAPPSAAKSSRAAMSMPLPRLGTQTTVGGTGDKDDDLDQLLRVRGSDIKSARGVESDPEPDLQLDTQGDPEPVLDLDLAVAQRNRGAKFCRFRASHGTGLAPVGLISEQVNLPQGVKEGLNTRACSGSLPGAGATSIAGTNIASGSGALTVSLGLMPYRRTSMPNNLAALMRSGTGGLTLGLDGVLHGLSGHGAQSGPGSPCSLGAGFIRSLPLAAYYQHLFRSCQPGAPGAVLVAGGLSVRMGVHSGVAITQVSYNRVAGRTQYSGAALETAKAVCDAAQGGMVLLSHSAFDQLALGRGGGASSGREPPHVVLYMGSHIIKPDPQPQDLYMAQSRELLARVAFLGPVRSSEQVEPGVLERPLGEVSMGVVRVVGLDTLMAWHKETTEEALALFQQVVVSIAMRRLGGHLVEAEPGKVVAVFGHPFDAVRWAAACEALLKEAEWSEALLSHELAEEVQGPVLLDSHMDAPVLMGDGELSRMLFRGLRIKGAVDCAKVKAELLPTTGQLNYRGNLIQNLQRIAAYVSTGQVVCTRRAWRGYERGLELASDVAGAADVVGACLGSHFVRGVGDKVELWSIRLEDFTYAASYYEDMNSAGTGGNSGAEDKYVDTVMAGRLKMLLPSPRHRSVVQNLAAHGVAAAALDGDAVGNRLGASLADTMAAQSRAWEMTGEELQNMLSE
ncbi:hypothetical protein VaNZ11_013786 [Volvox africanus]|uniref:Guanylate cyclase domain-containing protein n=1 Tax=Volvox africanus TaxID=51714 RepID=A0ABQ5SH03_9CHLO|nr:hypothetical protein VaNZ11_013786 [Volvox africanus]